MAEKDALKKLEEQLRCTICLDTYTNPKVLQCDHVYCRECIRQLLLRNLPGERSLTCPNCRQDTPVPENGVQGLKPALQINSLLDIQDSLLQQKVVDLPKLFYCHDHVNEELKLFCVTCEKLICFNCVIKGARHHDCEYEKMTDVYDRYKGEIETSLGPVKQNLAAIEGALEVFETSRGDVSVQQAVIEANIHSNIDQLQAILEVRRNKLVTQLHQLTQRKLGYLVTKHSHAEAIKKALQKCHINMKVKLDSMNMRELIEEKVSMINQIIDANSAFQPDILSPSTSASIEFTTSPQTSVLCQNHGDLSMQEELPDPRKCHATGSGLGTVHVGETDQVFLQIANHWGEPCEIPESSAECKLVSEITGMSKDISIECIEKGCYELNFAPAIKGWHHLHATISDQHINGSPYILLAKSLPGVKAMGKPIKTITDVQRPWGLVINHSRQIVVTEYGKHCVSIFTPSGVKILSFGTRGTNEGQFNHPCGVSVDEDDNILVADYKNNRIQKFNSEGEFITTVGTKGNKPLQFKGPKGIAFSTFNKKVYVADGLHRVHILNSDLTYCGIFSRPGIPDILTEIGLECDRFGRVYIPYMTQRRVQVFTAEGTFLYLIGNFGITNYISSVAFDNDDIMYVSDYARGRVSTFTLEGKFLDSLNTGTSSRPYGLAVDSGVLYVCNNNSISMV